MVRLTAATAGAAGAVLVLGIGLSGCGAVAASGPVVERDVPVDDVRAVELATSGDLTVRRGDAPSLTVRAAESVQDRLVSRVRDGVLKLDSRSTFGFSNLGHVEYVLVVPELDEVVVSGSGDVHAADVSGANLRVSVDGSGDVEVTGVDAEQVRVSIGGSGDVELVGRADAADLGVDGSGGIDADDLVVGAVRASIDGSGEIGVHARDTLDAEIGGSGTVSYTGDPRVTSDIGGSGSVERD